MLSPMSLGLFHSRVMLVSFTDIALTSDGGPGTNVTNIVIMPFTIDIEKKKQISKIQHSDILVYEVFDKN